MEYNVAIIQVLVSLLNLELGFPLCFYDGMTPAGKTGFQFVLPVYLWSIVLSLITSRFSVRLSNIVSPSSAQVLVQLHPPLHYSAHISLLINGGSGLVFVSG